MSIEEKSIKILNDGSVSPNDTVTIHLDYNESLTLKELSEVLDLVNKAFNDVHRDNGIKSNAKLGREYAAEVTGVDSGSIVVHILTCFVAPVALSVLANFLYDRLKGIKTKKEKNDKNQAKEGIGYPICINVKGDDNLIEVNITKPGRNESD